MSDRMPLVGERKLITATDMPDSVIPTVGAEGAPTVEPLFKPSGTPNQADLTTAAMENPTAIQPVEANYIESFGAGIGGLATTMYRSTRSALIYDRDPDFDSDTLATMFFEERGAGTPEEVKYLAAAKNEADFNERVEHIEDERLRDMAMADNPISGTLGSFIDADIAVGGLRIARFGNAATRTERIAERAGAGAIGAGAMVGINAAMGDTLRTEEERMGDVITMGLTRAFAPMAKGSAAVLGNTPAAIQVANNINANLNSIASTPKTAADVPKHQIVSKLTSTADELRYYTQGDESTIVNKLYSNPVLNNGDDVVSAQNVYINNYNQRLAQFEDSFKDAVTLMTGVRGNAWNRISGNYAAATQEVSTQFMEHMHIIDKQVLDLMKVTNAEPTPTQLKAIIDSTTSDKNMQSLIQSYIDSGIATRVYDDMKSSGLLLRKEIDASGNEIEVNGLDDIPRRSTYMPLRHNYDRIEDLVNGQKKATMDEVADFIGTQIARMYPDLLNPKGANKTFQLTTRQIGQHFLQTQRDASRNLTDVVSTGMNKEQIADILTRTGNFSDKEAMGIASEVFKEQHKRGTSTPKNLRTRIDWDWDLTMPTSTGHVLKMSDLVDNNVMGNLEDYTRGMAHRNGLADFGIRTESELENLLQSYLSKLPEGTNVQKARQFMKNTQDTLMGRPIENNPLPEGIRSAQAVADLFLLANSGLYGLIDLATQMQKVGVMRSLPHFKQGLKAVFNTMKSFTPNQAKDLEDVITGRLMAGSRWKNFTVRYADNFEVTSGIHEAAQYYGQSARFMNLSESIKRFQIGLLSGVYASNLKRAMLGDVDELNFMKNTLKIDDDLIKQIHVEYGKHGTNIDNWANGVRVAYERKVFHDADNLAMTVHRGEVPSFLEHSAVGRVIFPYMRFAFGMQNKVLRRTLARDGATGLAMVMAVQIPAAMLVGSAINVRTGKEPDDNLLQMTIKSMSALGSLNYPLEIALAGLDGGGVTAMAPFSKTYNFMKELGTGGSDGEVSPSQLLRNSPINAAMPLHYLLLATGED